MIGREDEIDPDPTLTWVSESAEVISFDRPRCPLHRVALAHTEENEREPYGWHCPHGGCPTFVPDGGD